MNFTMYDVGIMETINWCSIFDFPTLSSDDIRLTQVQHAKLTTAAFQEGFPDPKQNLDRGSEVVGSWKVQMKSLSSNACFQSAYLLSTFLWTGKYPRFSTFILGIEIVFLLLFLAGRDVPLPQHYLDRKGVGN